MKQVWEHSSQHDESTDIQRTIIAKSFAKKIVNAVESLLGEKPVNFVKFRHERESTRPES